MATFVMVLAIIWVLATEHTLLFWLVVVPLSILIIARIIMWLKGI